MEVLVALGIFTVGLVAVAAIFPTAIAIQRDTVREVDGRRIGKNAKAMILAAARTKSVAYSGEPYAEMTYTHNIANPLLSTGSLHPFVTDTNAISVMTSAINPTPVFPMIDLPEPYRRDVQGYSVGQYFALGERRNPADNLTLDAPASFQGLFNIDTRSYPKNNPYWDRRDYYWYPLIKISNLSSPEWSVTLIVMHRDGTNLPPEVRQSYTLDLTRTSGNVLYFNRNGLFNDGGDVSNDEDTDGLPDYIQPGDTILADNGVLHHVVLAKADSITVDTDNVGNPSSIYFGVSIDRNTGSIRREGRSPIVWIEDGIDLSIDN